MRRVIAVRLAIASMQPREPQPHFGPPALTVICPISPALPVAPGHDNSALNEAAANAGADKHGNDVLKPATRAEAKFAVAADADVILHQHWPAEERRETRAEREVPHVQVRAEEDDAGLGVERAGRADSRRGDVLTSKSSRCERLINAVNHRAQDRVGSFHRGRGALRLAENLVLRPDDPGEDLRPPQVDPKNRRPVALKCHIQNLLGHTLPAHLRAMNDRDLNPTRARRGVARARLFLRSPLSVAQRALPLGAQFGHEPLPTHHQIWINVNETRQFLRPAR